MRIIVVAIGQRALEIGETTASVGQQVLFDGRRSIIVRKAVAQNHEGTHQTIVLEVKILSMDKGARLPARLPAILAGDGPSADAPVGGEAMESILRGGERANNGGHADEARSVAAAAAVDAAAAAAAADTAAVAVLAARLSA